MLRFPGRYVGKRGKIELRNVGSVHKALGDNVKLLLGHSVTRHFAELMTVTPYHQRFLVSF